MGVVVSVGVEVPRVAVCVGVEVNVAVAVHLSVVAVAVDVGVGVSVDVGVAVAVLVGVGVGVGALVAMEKVLPDGGNSSLPALSVALERTVYVSPSAHGGRLRSSRHVSVPSARSHCSVASHITPCQYLPSLSRWMLILTSCTPASPWSLALPLIRSIVTYD